MMTIDFRKKKTCRLHYKTFSKPVTIYRRYWCLQKHRKAPWIWEVKLFWKSIPHLFPEARRNRSSAWIHYVGGEVCRNGNNCLDLVGSFWIKHKLGTQHRSQTASTSKPLSQVRLSGSEAQLTCRASTAIHPAGPAFSFFQYMWNVLATIYFCSNKNKDDDHPWIM